MKTSKTMDKDDLDIFISAIEHYSYCPRQCGLIHLEQTYEENLYTMRGKQVHESVDEGGVTSIRGVKSLRAIPLWSEKYGLRGKADLVEFIQGTPYPVEYKLGSAGHSTAKHAALQLCAQVLCLEEMLGKSISYGALYYATSRKRLQIEIDSKLREQTIGVIENIRAMLQTLKLPPANYDNRCRKCSLINSCLPRVLSETARLRGLQGSLFQLYDLLEVT